MTGQRRKGEQPVPRLVRTSQVDTVERAMRTGDSWFCAWAMQEATPTPRLAMKTKISVVRLREIEAGGTITRTEIEALARAWWITPDALIASMPDAERVIG